MKYRILSEEDRQPLTDWIAADEAHSETCTPDFWLSAPGGVAQSWAVEDEQGTLFYVRAENVLRLHIQFPPEKSKRLLKGVADFAIQIAQDAREKYKQIIFESKSPALIRFLEKRGYRHSPEEIVYDIPSTDRDR